MVTIVFPMPQKESKGRNDVFNLFTSPAMYVQGIPDGFPFLNTLSLFMS